MAVTVCFRHRPEGPVRQFQKSSSWSEKKFIAPRDGVGDDVPLSFPETSAVGVADLDDLVIAVHRVAVGQRVRVPSVTDLHVEHVVAILVVVVKVAERDRPEDPVLLQGAEVDLDVLGDGQRGVGSDGDVRVE